MSLTAVSQHSLSSFLPKGKSPTFIQPAHGGDNYCLPNSIDICRSSLLPALPDVNSARELSAWEDWADWQLAVALLPLRDTVNGERFDLRDIAPCVGSCTTNGLNRHVHSLYPNWEGRYRFMLKHILCVVKRYLRDGSKAHSREELIRLMVAKNFGPKN